MKDLHIFLVMVVVGVAACIGGSLAHSTAATVIGSITSGLGLCGFLDHFFA